MFNTIVYHINGVHPLLIRKGDYFHLIDHVVPKEEVLPENFQQVDFLDQASITQLPVLNGSFNNLIISSHLILEKDVAIDEQISKVCNAMFASLKNSYVLLMQQRNLKVWILEPLVSSTSRMYLAEINSFKVGLKALSTVVALELAKKKINVNYLENCDQSQEFLKFIEWSETQQHFYLSAQHLTVHGN